MRRLQRGGWPYPQPPNVQFDVNWDSPQAKGLVAWWPTLGSAGLVTLRNETGLTPNGTFFGAGEPAWIVDFEKGPSLEFDGTDDYIDAQAPTISYAAGNWSVAVWFKSNNLVNKQTVVGYGNGSVIPWHYWLLRIDTADNIEFWAYDGFANRHVDGTSTIDLNWHHVCATYDVTDNVSLYVDGNFEASGLAITADRIDAWDINTIGHPVFPPVEGRYFPGVISDVRIYGHVLTATEVWQLYAYPWELYKPRIPRFVVRSPVVAAAIMNQIQFSNVGADLYNGTLIP